MNAILKSAVLLAAMGALAQAEPSIPDDSLSFEDHQYYVLDSKLTWKEAQTHCEKAGGYLVRIQSAEEQAFVAELVKKASDDTLWIGGQLNEQTGNWMFSDNSRMFYTNWRGREPYNKDCACMKRDSGLWAGHERRNHDTRHQFVCEWDVDHAEAVATTEKVDLLAAVNLLSDALKGGDLEASEWRKEPNGLIGRSRGYYRLQIPRDLGKRYTIEVVFTRLRGEKGLILVLPLRSTQVELYVGNINESLGAIVSGLHLVDERNAGANVTARRDIVLETHRKHTLRVGVRVTGDTTQISSWLDKKQFLSFEGNVRRLSNPHPDFNGNPNRLAVGGYNNELVFHDIQLLVPVADTEVATRKEVEVPHDDESPAAPLLDDDIAVLGGDSQLADLVERVEPAVVKIVVEDGHGGGCQGSGFVTEDGYVVTNRHVMEDGVSATVIFESGNQHRVEGVLYDGGDIDICVIKVNDLPLKSPTLSIKTSLPRKGETVYAFGTPKGYEFTVSNGIVSGLRKFDADSQATTGADAQQYIQTTAPISSGNSGGPLVDTSGQVVGMSTWVRTDGQNLNFALACTEIADCIKKVDGRVQPLASLKSKDPVAKSVKYMDIRTVIMNEWDEHAIEQRKIVDHEIADWERKIATAKNDGERAGIKAHLAKLKHRRLCVFTEKTFELSHLYLSSLSKVSVGDYGMIQESIRILQVLDAQNCLVVIGGFGVIYRMSGFPTESLVDDQQFSAADGPAFVVSGTYQYATVSGTTKRVFIITPALGLEDAKTELIAKLKEQAKTSEAERDQEIQRLSSRIWKAGKYSTEAQLVRVGGIGGKYRVTLVKSDGKEIKVDLAKLSDEDQEWISGFKKYRNAPVVPYVEPE